jgi:hypothetical protein
MLEGGKAAPNGDMDFLQEIPPLLWIGFVRIDQAAEGTAIFARYTFIAGILIRTVNKSGAL